MALTAARPTQARAKNKPTIPQDQGKVRLSVDIPPDMLARLKAHAALQRVSIKDIVTRLIEEELSR